MRQGLPWYRREPRAFLDGCRAARLTERQFAVYTIVLDLIYDHGGETPDDPKHIASYLADTGTAATRKAIQQLVDIGKLFRVGDMLHQKRAENEAETREKLSETRAKTGRLGGVSSGNSRRQVKENNTIAEANASSKREAEKRREDKEEREAYASPKKIDPAPRKPNLMDVIRVSCGGEDTTAWSGVSAAENAVIWMGMGLTAEEIVEAARGWNSGPPPTSPRDLDALMNAALAAKKKPKPAPKEKRPSKGTSMSPEWEMPRQWKVWAYHEGLSIDEVKLQAATFKDYWLGIATQERGIKSDWEATWRNWVRKRLADLPKGTRNVTGSGPGQRIPEGGQRADAAIANIARLAGLEGANAPD